MRQLSLSDFRPRAIPCTSWIHEHDGRGWIYRSNAKAVVHDLNAMPSGMGIWPRMMGCRGHFGCDGWDLHHFQCRGCGSISKMIRMDGEVADFIRPNRFEIISPFRSEMATVFEFSERVGIVPRLKASAPMSEEFEMEYSRRRARDGVRRIKDEERRRHLCDACAEMIEQGVGV